VGHDAAGLTLFWRAPIERARDGGYLLRLAPEERAMLRVLPRELRSLLDADPASDDLRRLFPPAYENDADGEGEYHRLMDDELAAGRRDALRILEETVDRDRLDEEEAHAWLGALNDLRLVLGTRLGVTEELYERDFDPRDPRGEELAVYLYLSWLQEQLVSALAGDLD
jgi:hypothetical protein